MELTDYIEHRRKRHLYLETMLKNVRRENENALRNGLISREAYDVLMKDWPIMEEITQIEGRIIDLLECEMLGLATEEEKALLERLGERMRNAPRIDTKDLDELGKKYKNA